MSLTKSALVLHALTLLDILQRKELSLPWKVIIHFKGIIHRAQHPQLKRLPPLLGTKEHY